MTPTSPDPARQRAEAFLSRPCYGTQYVDHEAICAVCKLTKVLTLHAAETERQVWAEAARYAESREVAGGPPADEYEQGMHSEARLAAIEFRRRAGGG